jgi:hypothetical protein
MLEFLKRLLGLAPNPVAVAEPAPYKVETPAPYVVPVPTPVESSEPKQVDKKESTGTAKSTTSKGTSTGVKPARRRRKPTAT